MTQTLKLNRKHGAKLGIQLKSNWIFSRLLLYIYIYIYKDYGICEESKIVL